jgi:hypothetical protein
MKPNIKKKFLMILVSVIGFLLIQKIAMKTGLLRKKYIIKYAKMLQIL